MLANSLKLSMSAEGVETLKQLAALRRMGCDEAQGCYLSKPLPAEKFGGLLRGNEAWIGLQ